METDHSQLLFPFLRCPAPASRDIPLTKPITPNTASMLIRRRCRNSTQTVLATNALLAGLLIRTVQLVD